MKRQKQVFVIGALVGALVGILTAYMVVTRWEELERAGKSPRIQANLMDWLKLGVSLLGLVRRLAGMLSG